MGRPDLTGFRGGWLEFVAFPLALSLFFGVRVQKMGFEGKRDL